MAVVKWIGIVLGGIILPTGLYIGGMRFADGPSQGQRQTALSAGEFWLYEVVDR